MKLCTKILNHCKKWSSHPVSFFAFFLLIIPIEHKYDRFFRKFLYAHTAIPKEEIKTLYLYPTDFLIFCLLIFSLFYYREKILSLFVQPQVRWATFLWCWIVISLAITPNVNWVQLSRTAYLFISFSFFILFVDRLRRGDLISYIPIFMGVIFCLGLFEAIVGLLQYFSQEGVGLRLLGEPKLNSVNFGRAAFFMKEGSLTLFDHLFIPYKKELELMRAYGTFSHPNVLGAFLNLSLVMGYYFFHKVRSLWKRSFFSIAIACQVFALVVTFSRAALFTSILVFLIWTWCARKEIKPSFIILYGIILFSAGVTFYPQLRERGGIVNYQGGAVASDQERIESGKVALEVIKRHPIAGVGYANFTPYAEKHFGQKVMVHNAYLLMIAEFGIFGFLLFMILIGHGLYQGMLFMKDLKYLTLFSAFLALLSLGMFDYYLLFFQPIRLLFFFILALLCTSSVYVWHWKAKRA